MKQILLVLSVVLFILAGLSALITGFDVSELALISFGLAAYAGKDLVA